MNEEELIDELDDASDLATFLIASEEIQRPRPTQQTPADVEDESEDLFFVQNENVMKKVEFTPLSSDKPTPLDGPGFPVHAQGRLDSFIVVSDSRNFEVQVTVDNSDVVDDTFSRLATIQQELTHISAYQTQEKFVVSVQDYPFREFLNIIITPSEEIEFELIRVEAIIE